MAEYSDELETVKIAKEEPEAVRNFAQKVDDPLKSKLLDIVESVSDPPQAYVYIAESESGMVKIGKSKNPENRIRQLSTGSPEKLELKAQTKAKDAHELEKEFHRQYSDFRAHGEWFEVRQSDKETLIEKVRNHNET